MKKDKGKNITIVVLVLIVIALIIISFLRFNDYNKADRLIRDSLVAQLNISEYIGKMKSDTFDIYTTEQLLIGSTDIENIDTTTIKNNDNEDLLKLVSIEGKISQGDSTYYMINTDNFEKKFSVTLYKDDGIIWYVKSTGDIKVSYTSKPSWWTQELNALYIGK